MRIAFLILFLFIGSEAHALDLNGREITDSKGRRVEVKKPFTRIISLYGAHTENIVFMGGAKRLTGISKHDSIDILRGSKIRKYSYRDGVEKFIFGNPDLVIIRPMIDRSYKGLIKKLSRHAEILSLQPESINEMFLYWKILGVLTGCEEKASEMVENFKKGVKAFESIKTDGKRVYFESIHRKMKTFNKYSMAAFVLAKAGGINVAKDAKQVRRTNIAYYGKERILQKADIIDVYLAQKGVMNRTSVNIIKNEPGFSLIKAVKNNRIYIIDEEIVSRPTMRLLKGIYTAGSCIYPEKFKIRGEAILKKYMR